MSGDHQDPSAISSELPPVARRPIDFVLAPVRAFTKHTLAGAGLLLLATLVALLWANSGHAESYAHMLHMTSSVAFGELVLSKSLHHLINDGLMGIFFFLVGLEIKREVLVGELSTLRQAALPAVAAVGGMVVPALLYVAVNPDEPLRNGWGVPMATDIAFALGVLALLRDRVPPGLRVLLTALAIVDDIGAVLVIAVFYTDQIAVGLLLLGLLGFACSVGMNVLGVRSWIAYLSVGLLVWLAFLQSGVHATIAALLMAFTIPARTQIDGAQLMARLDHVKRRMERVGPPPSTGLNTPEQEAVLDEIAALHSLSTAPLQQLEHAIAPLVTFVILPTFALANAGVSFGGAGVSVLGEGIALGIICGLLVGKPLGVVSCTYLAVKTGLCDLPAGVRFGHVLGVGFLAGIGFTMALFIADLAFATDAALAAAKMGILAASLVAALAGLVILATSSPRRGRA